MKRTLLLALLLAAASLSAAPRTPARAEKHVVEKHFMAGITRFNAHDLDGFMQQFGDDIEMYTAAGWIRGGAAVRQRFAETFGQFPSIRMEIDGLRVREAAPGVALVDFAWHLYPSGEGPAYHGVGSGVYLRRNGRWVEVLEHETLGKVDAALAAGRK